MSNVLQDAILARAEAWRDCGCCETVSNGGTCVDSVTEFYTGKNPLRKAWCAMTVWTFYAQACQSLGIINTLPKTAGARDLLERSTDTGFPISNDPSEADFFYIPPRSGTSDSSGHVGTVFYTGHSDYLVTIEGNSSQRLREVHHPWSEVRSQAVYPGWKGSPYSGKRQKFIFCQQWNVPLWLSYNPLDHYSMMEFGPRALDPIPNCQPGRSCARTTPRRRKVTR